MALSAIVSVFRQTSENEAAPLSQKPLHNSVGEAQLLLTIAHSFSLPLNPLTYYFGFKSNCSGLSKAIANPARCETDTARD